MTKLSIVTVLIGSLLAPQAATAAALTPAEWLSLRGALDGAAAERGAALYEQNGCGGCHGPRGVPEHRNLPVLAGQRSAYLYKQLLDYRSKRLTGGTGEVMAGVSASLSEPQVADLATWLASLPRPAPSPQAAPLPAIASGDPVRLIPPCEGCHGAHGEGWDLQPAIRGQNRDFLADALNRFKSGQRSNDIHDGMGQIARNLSDAEIRLLADHYGR